MPYNIITYGIIRGKVFYVIQKHNDYCSLWATDIIPSDMTDFGIRKFMDEHCLDGFSVSGTYEQTMKEFADLILDGGELDVHPV